MKRLFFCFVLFLTALPEIVYCQELVAEHNTKLVPSEYYPLLSFPVVDDADGSLYIFTHDRKGFTGYPFRKGAGFTSEIESKHPKDKFIHYMGCTVKDSVVWMYLGDEFNRRMLVREFDFNSGGHYDTELKPFPGDEVYLTSVEMGDKNFILTVKKNGSVLGVYCLEGGKVAGSKRTDLSEVKFAGYTLYDALNSPSADALFIPSIGSFIRPALTFHDYNALNKVFAYNGQIYITLNNDLSCTHLITINTVDLSVVHSRIETPSVGCSDGTSNSFFFKGILYQLHVCREGMKLSGFDVINSRILKEYTYKAGEPEITFANSSVTERSSGEIISLQTNDFLNKAAAGAAGLMVKENGNNISITTGITRGGKMFSFGSLFSSAGMEHVEGELSGDDVVYRIMDFFRTGNRHRYGVTVFLCNDKAMVGYYERKQKKYYLFEF